MDTESPAVAVTGLVKEYHADRNKPPLRALDNLNLEIGQGEIYGLIGPNGAGKTTLLKILSTLLYPTRGLASVAGFDCVEQREDVCMRVGFMPELFALYEEMRVWEYLEFFAGAYGLPAVQRRKTIEDVLELTDLGGRRDAFAGTLSKGMRQRLLMAKTLIHDPEVLILDEPISGVDPQGRIEFRNVVRTLAAMGKTIIVSSHILSDLSAICTAAGIIEAGKLRASGTIDELRNLLESSGHMVVKYLREGTDPVLVLEGLPGVTGARHSGGGVVFHFDGTEQDRAAVLKRLVQAGVVVSEYFEKRSDLEDIFMQVGANKVQ